MLLFGVLTVETIVIIAQIFRNKLYKSSVLILLWFAINTFYSPAFFYTLLNGKSYKEFSDFDYNIYINIGVIYLLLLIYLNLIFCNTHTINFKLNIRKIRIRNLAKAMSIVIIFLAIVYTLVYRNNFPLLYQLLYGKLLERLERPDVSGTIPFYFTISTLICTFLPMCYFYFKERYNNSHIKDVISIAFIVFFLTVGGNKGLLVYFAIFIWIYIGKMKVDWRIIATIIFLLCIYEITIYGSIESLDGDLLKGLIPPIRRFFVTQGAMFINRIALINQHHNFGEEYISAEVYTFVYKGTGGSAPTYFLGDLLVQFGYIAGFIVGTIFTMLIYIISKITDRIEANKLYVVWSVYYLIYLLGNSSISWSFLIRLTIVGFLTLFLSLNKEIVRKNIYNMIGFRNYKPADQIQQAAEH